MAADRVTEEIKARLSIIDVVSPYVKLSKSGKSHKGLSPFTKEKTPSFFVSPDRGTYYCFSTNQGGDIFTFIEKMEGVDFRGALKMLAEKAGVPLVEQSEGSRDAREKIYEALAFAEQFFHTTYTNTESARAYIARRGITEETATLWRIGYAPSEWRSLIEKAGKEGITQEALLSAGLIKEADNKKGTFYDRFRDRVMFPIRDTAGRTIGFSGRALNPSPEVAKYLNSPETDVFKKSHLMYGFDKAREPIRTRGFIMVVEGQIDLVLAHQAGFTNTVALSGTAFTDIQLSSIVRLTKHLMLALDGDKAGMSSMRNITVQGFGAGMEVKIVALPLGKDPADVILENVQEFAGLVKNALPAIDFFTMRVVEEFKERHAMLTQLETLVLPIVKNIQSSIQRDHALEKIARTTSVSLTSLKESVAKGSIGGVREEVKGEGTKALKVRAPLQYLKALLTIYPESEGAKAVKECLTVANVELPEDIEEDILFDTERGYEKSPDYDEGKVIAQSILRTHIQGILSGIAKDMARSEALGDGDQVTMLSEASTTITETLKKLLSL